ncbi:TetR/AcrR family transcriptional regulator [Leucobacter soli]|uniref:TetR/AcrR family transcriptional regulator n=1 Tax=Leucobacter soli TaxID=2812850 RepID=UPI001F3098FC|nr:TetR/AcrR family transcriptional regulator [Leucobacter soli]
MTIKQIADRADVSLATVYAHFPQKEALVFDVDDAVREGMVAAVRDRASGVTIFQALQALQALQVIRACACSRTSSWTLGQWSTPAKTPCRC